MTLVFAVMQLYKFFLLLLLILFLYFKKNLVLINRRNGPRYQRVLALRAFFDRGDTEGTNSSVCFVLFKFVSGLILWFLDNLWFDDLRAE